MLARLWWKDVRQFWPIWLILAATSAACQWLLLRFGGNGVRHGTLPMFAAGWALLYGFAVSSAAFAGERENDTLGFLDLIPVGRGVLWRGKASFAVVSAFVLAVVLVAMAWPYTDRWPTVDSSSRLVTLYTTQGTTLGVTLAGLALGAFLLEVLGWGLFWSAVSSNAMVAAVLAIVCSVFGIMLQDRWSSNPDDVTTAIPWRIALFVLTSTASAWVITRGGRAGRSWGEVLSREMSFGTAGGVRTRPARARFRILSPQFRALVWQTSREVWPVWWRLVSIGFGLPALSLLSGNGADPGLVVMLNEILVVVVGVSVFGAENRRGTQKFLAHHGARPGVVWGVKVAVWSAWFFPPWVLLTTLTGLAQVSGNQSRDNFWFMGFLVTLTGAAVGLVCGMTIRRGITAGLVAVVGVFATGVPQILLMNWQMLPWVIPLIVPLALVVASWAWSADWMLERPGFGRWVRLGLLMAGAFASIFAVHIGFRVWSVPDVGPGFDVQAFVRAAEVDEKDNAAGLYREAGEMFRANLIEAATARNKGEQDALNTPARREKRTQILALIRRASAMPHCRFVKLGRVTRLDPYESRGQFLSGGVDWVVAESVKAKREAGDLAGAWDDLMVMFKMARHLSGPVPIGVTHLGLKAEHTALGLAMQWSADPRQTPGRVRAALDAYLTLPPMPSLADTIRAESIIYRNTLRLPTEDLMRVTRLAAPVTTNEFERTAVALHLAALTSPWEVARARRSLELFFRSLAQSAAAPPVARSAGRYLSWNDYVNDDGGPGPRRMSAYELVQLESTTPLVAGLLPARDALFDANDTNEVGRRALVLVLALRHWQLTHAGALPGSLDDLLTPGPLKTLPTDPYTSGSPFRYARSRGEWLLPRGPFDAGWTEDATDLGRFTKPNGRRILYSVGPDRVDNRGEQDLVRYAEQGDIIFVLPDDARAGEDRKKDKE